PRAPRLGKARKSSGSQLQITLPRRVGSRKQSGMKNLLTLAGLFTLTLLVRADEDFTKSLTPDELAATGLAKLSTDELARLKAVVERYKSGEIAVVQQQAEVKVAAAEAKVREAATAPSADKRKPSWLMALITLKKVEDKPDKAEAFDTRIEGDFKGWTGHTTFKLDNGQVWQQNGDDSYYGDLMHSPKARIYPGALGSYWMDIEGIRQRVKVKPIRLE
ncbi:MAG: hypothetical protein ACREB3_03515, partial [Burkholderiales bacterium]